jgi:hypothetical protein
MRLPLFLATVLVVSVISSVCTAMVCLQLSPRAPATPSSAQAPGPAPTAPSPAVAAPAARPRLPTAATRPELARAQPAPAAEPAVIPPPPPPLDEVIPPPPEAPPRSLIGQARTPAPAPAPAPGPAASPAPAPDDVTPVYVQHEVDEAIYRDYYGCTQAEVVVINTCQRCYQFHHADVLAVCLVARWAGVPLSVAFRTYYDDDHGSLQALVTGYHLDPGIFFVTLAADLACPGPYQRPYLLFRTLRGSESAYSNDEYRALIALKIACDYQGRQPVQFFATVQNGATPLQAVYRTPTPAPAPAVPARRWSGNALSPTGHATASDHRPTAGTPVSATTRGAGEIDADAAPHAGAATGAPLRLDRPARGDQAARGDAQEHAPPTAADAGHGGSRPAATSPDRRAVEPVTEHATQGPVSHEAVSAPPSAPATHSHAEPSEPVSGSGSQPGGPPGGQAASGGAVVVPRH